MASEPLSIARRFYLIASLAITVAILYFARDLLIPVALAVFLSFLLAPLATRLERLGLGKIPGSLMSVALAFVVIVALGFLVTDQVIKLADQLPQYEDNIRSKTQALQHAARNLLNRGAGPSRSFSESLSDKEPATSQSPPTERLGHPEIVGPMLTPPVSAAPDARGPAQPEPPSVLPGDGPVPVRIVREPQNPLAYIAESLSSVIGWLGTAGVVIVLAIFMLVQRRDMRDRLIALTGRGQVFVTTRAFDEISSRISRYLLMQLMVNTSYAVPVTIGLTLFDIPNALLLGLMALFLRFIPYVGAMFTAAVSILLAITVMPGWGGPLGVLAFFIVLELIVNNVIEPWFYSLGTGVSVLGVIFSAIFWAWIWGPVGLILATPIAVLLTVIGKYIPQLAFLDILLGGRTQLEPKLRFIQRLLAMDQAEAAEIAEEYCCRESLLSLYDNLIVPALQLAEEERHRGQIGADQESFLLQAFREIIDETAAQEIAARAAQTALAEPPSAESPPTPTDAQPRPAEHRSTRAGRGALPPAPADVRIVVLPAGDEADELAGLMLEHLLRAEGYPVDTASVERLSSELVAEVQEQSAQIVFISALPPGALVAARYLCKRVSSKWPDIPILVGLWNATGNVAWARERLESCGKTKVVTTYAAALAETVRAAQSLQFTT